MSKSGLTSVWDNHPDHPVSNWKLEIENDETRLGYLSWVENQMGLALSRPDNRENWDPESHWDDHDEYPVEDWKTEVENDDTRGSYIGYVNSRIDMLDPEEDEDASPPAP